MMISGDNEVLTGPAEQLGTSVVPDVFIQNAVAYPFSLPLIFFVYVRCSVAYVGKDTT
jgi:hypothetical protein